MNDRPETCRSQESTWQNRDIKETQISPYSTWNHLAEAALGGFWT